MRPIYKYSDTHQKRNFYVKFWIYVKRVWTYFSIDSSFGSYHQDSFWVYTRIHSQNSSILSLPPPIAVLSPLSPWHLHQDLFLQPWEYAVLPAVYIWLLGDLLNHADLFLHHYWQVLAELASETPSICHVLSRVQWLPLQKSVSVYRLDLLTDDLLVIAIVTERILVYFTT